MNGDMEPPGNFMSMDTYERSIQTVLKLLKEQNEIVGRALENAGMATLHAYNKSLSERIEEEMKK